MTKNKNNQTIWNKRIGKDSSKLFQEIGSSINIDKSRFDFADMMTDYRVPFPCNGTWDRKAWWWLESMESKLEGDILFWNIGGNI